MACTAARLALACFVASALGMTYTDGSAAPTPVAEILEFEEIGARQVTGQGLGATLVQAQQPAVTTVYLPTQLGTSNTWLPFPYTQTFPLVPDQWPSPAAGQIGLGTLAKREAEATPEPVLGTGVAGRVQW